METNRPCDWEIARPGLRLTLTVALGLLGAWLMRHDLLLAYWFAPDNLPLFLWTTAAFFGVLIVHRVEKVKTGKGTVVVMGAALLLLPVIPLGPDAMRTWYLALIPFAWFCGIVIGASIIHSGWHYKRDPHARFRFLEQCREVLDAAQYDFSTLLRGFAIAVSAPLLLFASRPVGRGRLGWKVAFAVFPFLVLLLAGALPLRLVLELLRMQHTLGERGERWISLFYSFPAWAWLGCALLLLLSPWPVYPRIDHSYELSPVRKVWWLGVLSALAVAVFALLPLGLANKNILGFLHPAIVWGTLSLALMLLILPWPEYPRLPKMAELPSARKTGPWGTGLFLGMVLLSLGAFSWEPLIGIISGRLFEGRYDPTYGAGVFEWEFQRNWFYFVVELYGALLVAMVAAARWASDRSTRWGYWTFSILAAAICLCIACNLTRSFSWLVKYTRAVGPTTPCVYGLFLGVVGYIALLGFLLWAVWPPKKTGNAGEPAS